MTQVKFKRRSKIIANQLISAQQAPDSEEEYETISERGDSPPKKAAVAKTNLWSKTEIEFPILAGSTELYKRLSVQSSFVE